MRPIILIIEARPEVAEALQDAVPSAHYEVMVRPHVEYLTDLEVTPAAIIVRIAFDGIDEPPHAVIGRLLPQRPPVIAIAWEECAVAEAERLGCDVVLHAPHEVGRLCEALTSVVDA